VLLSFESAISNSQNNPHSGWYTLNGGVAPAIPAQVTLPLGGSSLRTFGGGSRVAAMEEIVPIICAFLIIIALGIVGCQVIPDGRLFPF